MIRETRRMFDVQCRSEKEGEMILEGYALKFDKETELWQEMHEVIRKGALDNTDMSRVFLLLNHNEDKILAGTRNGSLTLKVDDIGLWFSAVLVDTATSKEVYQLAKSGLLEKCSFSFMFAKENGYTESKHDDYWLREITGIDKLYDVAVVTYPAYDDTEAYARSSDLEKERAEWLAHRSAIAKERIERLQWN